jgi:ABC-type phosphate transport system permease subunit
MLSQHPANRLLRLVLLAATLIATGQMLWTRMGSTPQPTEIRYLAAFGVPLLLAVFWYVFTASNEPDYEGRRILSIPGGARMALEVSIFLTGIWSLLVLGRAAAALGLAVGLFLHYYWSAERVTRLLRR